MDASTERERVLLVDDRRDNLMALEAVLEPLGFELMTARSGADALRVLLNTEVSAILLDVQMPDMDGFETAALLKSREATKSVPVLFLTAVGLSLDHELRGYEVGGFDYICKPFEPKVLQAKVRAAVRWAGEMRALMRAARVYREAGGALDAVHALGAEDLPARTERVPKGPASLVVTTRLLERRFEGTVTAPAVARAEIRRALDGKREELTDVVILLVSELLANAILHARSAATVRLDVGPAMVRVEVDDAGVAMPSQLPSDVTEESGRGLLLVQRLSNRCGWNQLPDGKSVWFELHGPGERPGS